MDDLLTIAKKHVLQGYENKKDMLSKISALEVHLNDVFDSRGPNVRDYDNRRDLIRIFNEIAKEIYGTNSDCPVVEEFGSFLMDMFSAKSDLDLSVNFRDKIEEARRDAKIKALRKFAHKFFILQKKKHVTNVKPILSAMVPVLKVTDCGTGIECDLSVGNLDGIAKSNIILLISSIDERFKKLCFLMKAWAKAYDINSSKDGSLNSLSIILLVAFHLQTREPAILPPFSAIFKDGTDPEAVKKNIPSFENYGKGNKESLSDLFVSLLIMLESVESLWPLGLCVSTYEGSWIYKTWEARKGIKIGIISIEDFSDRSQNTARAVKVTYIGKIYSSIRHSLQQIQHFAAGRIDGEKLKIRLFGPDSFTEKKVVDNIAYPDPRGPNLPDPTTQKKRKRTKQKSETKQLKKQDGGSGSVVGPQDLVPKPSKPLQKRTKQKSEIKQLKQGGSSDGGSQDPVPKPSNPLQKCTKQKSEIKQLKKQEGGSSDGGSQDPVPKSSNPLQKCAKQKSEIKQLKKQDGGSGWSQDPAPKPSNPLQKKPKKLKTKPSNVQTSKQAPLPPKQTVQSPVGVRHERSRAETSRYATSTGPYHHTSLTSTSDRSMPYHSTRVCVGPSYGREMPYHPASTPYNTSGNAMHTPYQYQYQYQYQPGGYLPPAPYTPHSELERLYSFTAGGSYGRPVERNYQHYSHGENSAYPPFFL